MDEEEGIVMSDLSENLKRIRKAKKLSQQGLADIVGTSKQVISRYERGERDPKSETLFKIANALHVSPWELVGWDYTPEPGVYLGEAWESWKDNQSQPLVQGRHEEGNVLDALRAVGDEPPARQLSADALVLARDYEALDDYGRKAVRVVADVERERMDQEAEQGKRPAVAPVTYIRIKRFDEAAAAGSPVWAESGYSYVRYPENLVPQGADYAVGITGRSMEPDYPDGCTVFVRSTQAIKNHDVVVAWLEGEGTVCKRAVFNGSGTIVRLESINRNYEDYTLRQLIDMRILGKVLGYVMG
jgi:transcriptional regulator with XRE-family HTH domain